MYAPSGTYQLQCSDADLVGPGMLFEDYLKLKDKLYREGLFDASHKKRLPAFPFKIGIITSAKNQALQDIFKVAKQRSTGIKFTVVDCPVQGVNSVKSIIKALKYLDTQNLDIIVLTRGGGEYEDLNTFNSSDLAYAVYNADTAVVSAIGHEADNVITDFVASLRCSTPTNAAETIIPCKDDIISSLNEIKSKMIQSISTTFSGLYGYLVTIKKEMNAYINQRTYKTQSNLLILRSMIHQNSPNNLISNSINKVSQLYTSVDYSINRSIEYYLNKLNMKKISLEHFKATLLNKVEVALSQLKRLGFRVSIYEHIENKKTEIIALNESLDATMAFNLMVLEDSINQCKINIEIMSPKATLDRGYTLLIDSVTRETITSFQTLEPSTEVKLISKSEVAIGKIIIDKIIERIEDKK